MNIKRIALIGLLAVTTTLHAKTVEAEYFAEFTGKLSLENGTVYVTCPGMSVSSMGEVIPLKHAEAVDTGDPNYKKLKAAAAQGKTVPIEARFGIENHKLYVIVANANGRR